MTAAAATRSHVSTPPAVSHAHTIPTLGYGDYVRFRKLVHVWFGLSFPENRRTDLERGIRQAFAASTCADLDEYYRLLQERNKGAIERERLVNALTVNETHFFRNAGHFDALFNHILPQIIERRRQLRTMRIWSAGCASGEEPYSIAMMLRMLLPDIDEWSITILGTDINTEALDRARKGVYGQWAFREERAKELRPRFFRPCAKRFELSEAVRNMVTLARLNLMEDTYPAYETNTTLMDLILCRNVTIYFSEYVTREIVNRFYDALVDGGWLIVGHSEHTLGTYRRFEARTFPNAILYQRTGQPTAWPKDWEWLVGPPAQAPQTSEAWSDVHGLQPLVLSGIERAPNVPGPVPTPVETVALAEPMPVPDPAPTPEEEPDPIERARELLDFGHSQRARELLLQTFEQRPEALVCSLLGKACANLGLWQDAQEWCSRAISLDRLALDAYYMLALVSQHQGNLDAAIDAMRKVVYIDRNSTLGHFGLADLYHAKGQLPQALKALDNARRLLDAHVDQELIPDSGGITVGRLRQTVVRQQQLWSEEASARPARGHRLKEYR